MARTLTPPSLGLDPAKLYLPEEAAYYGFSRLSLRDGRRANVLHPITSGRKRLYEGAELIEWRRQERQQNRKAS